MPTGLGAGHGMTVFELTKPSLAAEFDWVARLVARLPVDPLAATGRISINVWRAGRLGVIDIADDGPGIPREHWENLFLAFRSKQRGGAGLGLAIARDLAVVQGGALKLTRSTEDGSEFRLQLPMEMFTSSR